MALEISVVICCHNSANRLSPVLQHLAKQTGINPDEWEVILVDNNSDDNTAQYAEKTWAAMGHAASLRIVREEQPGIVYARLKGVHAAQAEIIAFVDDDNWLESPWLRHAVDIMAQHAEVGALGGSVEAIYQNPPANGIQSMESLLACGTVDESYEEIFPQGGLIVGAGCVIRRSSYLEILAKMGPFEMTGRKGSELTGGDDVEILYKLQLLGYKVMRSGKLRLRHSIPVSRTTIPYFLKLARGTGMAAVRLDPLRRTVCRQDYPSFWFYRLWLGIFARLIRSAPSAIIFGEKRPRQYIDFHSLKSSIAYAARVKSEYQNDIARLRHFRADETPAMETA